MIRDSICLCYCRFQMTSELHNCYVKHYKMQHADSLTKDNFLQDQTLVHFFQCFFHNSNFKGEKYYLIIFFSWFEFTSCISSPGFIKEATGIRAHLILGGLWLADLKLIMHFSFSNSQFLHTLIVHFREQVLFNDKGLKEMTFLNKISKLRKDSPLEKKAQLKWPCVLKLFHTISDILLFLCTLGMKPSIIQ